MKLDWKKIDQKFDKWFMDRVHRNSHPEWYEQWSYIKRVVNSELRATARRKK